MMNLRCRIFRSAPAVLAVLMLFCFCVSVGAKKKQEVAPSYAWRMLEPLGLHEEATIDTSLVDYGQRSVPSGLSEAWATTGNLGGSGRNSIWWNRPATSDFFFRDAVAAWIPEIGNCTFYNTRIPMTLVSYNTGGTRDNSQDRLGVIFSGNAGPKLQIGAMLDYLYSKGSYNYQAAKDMAWGLSTSYMSDHYELQAFFNHYNLVEKANGGITDDRYITDPAEVQGGSTKVNYKSVPTRLSASHNRVAGQEFFMNHRYKLGFYERIERPDTLPEDSVEHRRFVPVASFIWTLDYIGSRHVFDNSDAREEEQFWENHYFSLRGTHDNTRYWSIRNTFGISLLEGFNKYAKAGLAAFLTHEYRRYNQAADTIPLSVDDGRPADLTPYPLASRMSPSGSENLLWVGAQLTKQRGSWVRYEATGRIGLIGRAAGEIDLSGEASLRVPLLRDTLAVTGYARFANRAVPYLLEKFVSNHFIWDNEFGKTRTFRFGGRLDFPRTRTHLDIGVENVQNLVYFGEDFLPRQHGSSVQVFSARLSQNFRAGILNWDNSLTYQTSTDDQIIPLPKFAIYSNLYIRFKVARVLDCQIGVDCDYYTRYYAPGYQPSTMAFTNQRETMCGNYPFMNAYANFKLRQARFYVMMSHVNQGIFGNDFFSMPHYPLNPRRFQMGVSVDFAN
ncbi:MAG: putative porin [Clostridium sp.]|nr:putative porin [Clostridium sp.]